MVDDNIVTQVFEANPRKKKPSGRDRKTWSEEVRRAMKRRVDLEMTNLSELVQIERNGEIFGKD